MNSGDDSEVLISVQDLSNMLLHAANEEALRGLDQTKFVASLLGLLNYEHNGEIMLLAVRSLCGLMEALPQSCATVVATHGVEQLCAKLLMITYVDVAEECIKAIHRLAMDAPGAVLRDGGMTAVLAYLDFFAVAVQRKAVEAAAYMCRGATAELREQVEGSLDSLLKLLEYEDGQVASRAMEAVALVAEHWCSSADLMDVLFQKGRTSESILRVLADPALPHWSRAVRTLQLGCQISPSVLVAALQQGLAASLTAAYSAERAAEVLQLAAEMFPQLPPEALGNRLAAAVAAAPTFPRPKKGAAPAVVVADARLALMESERHLFGNVLSAILPMLVRSYTEAASQQLRARAVLALARAVMSAPLSLLGERTELAPFLVALLREQGPDVLSGQTLALCCARRLLQGLPEPFVREMRREGLAWAIVGLGERLKGKEEGDPTAAFCGSLCRDAIFAGEKLGDSDEERELREAARDMGTRPEQWAALLQKRPPSAWELKRAQVAEAIVSLSVAQQQAMWDHLSKRPEAAQMLVDGLLQHCSEELIVSANADEPVDPGLAIKIMMQPIPIGLRPAAGGRVPDWSDSGGAAVEPLTKMSRLAAFVWERIDSAANRPAAVAGGGAAAAEAAADEEEDEISGMDESEFREYMSSRLADLGSMEPEQRAAHLERLKRAINSFAAAARVVPKMEPGDDEGIPEEEARQVREAAEAARETLARRLASRPQLRFRLGDNVARPDQTLYSFLAHTLNQRGRSLWGAAPVLEYFAATEQEDAASVPASPLRVAAAVAAAAARPASELALGVLFRVHVERPCGLRFLSSRLTGAVAAATRDLLACAAGALPEWAMAVARAAPWLLPLATRRELMEKSAYGSLSCLADVPVAMGKGYSYDGNQSIFQYGRLPRAKVRVKRDCIWATCRTAMHLYAGVRSQLEVDYYGEQGVGLGPTLEFWTLVSRDMQLRSLQLWLDTAAPADAALHCLAAGPGGLFPRPSAAHNAEWTLTGTLMAKAMLDGRLLDLPVSLHFWHVMLDLQPPLSLDALRHVYPEAHSVLAELSRGADCKYDPADLGLCMTLVGRDEWELVPGGAAITLTRDNCAEYVTLSVEALLGRTGHAAARRAFAEGWNKVFPLESLRLLTPAEITQCLCGDGANYSDEMWSVENLRRNTRAEHGYDSSSRIVTLLYQVLATRFSLEDRKAFLRFATGSPRLPVGGFASLHPRLTVVEKSDPGRHADESLPSVMTCVNYLKLPCYSSVEVLEKRLRTAMLEGCSGFFLS